MRSVWNALHYRLEYLGLRLVGGIFALLPLGWASAFSGWLWRMIAPLFYRHARALANLAAAFPEATLAERETIARSMWENLGRNFAESFHLAEIAKSDRIDVENPGLLDEMAGGGCIICGGHLANWELAAAPLLRHGLATCGVYQTIKNPLVDVWLQATRAFLYPGGLYPKGASTARHLSRHARNGGAAMQLVDLRESSGIAVDFFGHQAPSTAFPAKLARLLDMPIFVVILMRLPGVRFRFRIERIEVMQSDDRNADVLATTSAIHARLERAIRAHPQQWMWAHRRWG